MTVVLKIEEFLDDIEELYAGVDEKVEETLDQVYEKVPGKYFGLIGLLIYAISTFTAVLLYLSVDPSYSMFTHWISHLGDGPNGANLVFNIGWIVSSFVLFFFQVYEIRTLRKEGVKEWYLDLMSIASLSFTVGILLIGIFPLHTNVLHTIFAIIYFAGGFGFTMLYGIIILTLSDVSNKLAFAAFTTATCYLLYFSSPVISIYTSQIGITIFFLEWLTLLSALLMMVIVIVQHFLIDIIKNLSKKKN